MLIAVPISHSNIKATKPSCCYSTGEGASHLGPCTNCSFIVSVSGWPSKPPPTPGGRCGVWYGDGLIRFLSSECYKSCYMYSRLRQHPGPPLPPSPRLSLASCQRVCQSVHATWTRQALGRGTMELQLGGCVLCGGGCDSYYRSSIRQPTALSRAAIATLST